MKSSARHVLIGLGLGLFAVAGVFVIIVLTVKPSPADALAEGRRLADEARAEEADADALEREGKREEAEARRIGATGKYDQAIRAFIEIYSDLRNGKNTRVTAAYYIGLIQYARGSEENISNAVSLLKEVAANTQDPIERFESCRVLMSYAWAVGDFDAILTLLRFLQSDRETLRYINDQFDIIKAGDKARDTLAFFKDHPEPGLGEEDIAYPVFSDNDDIYWRHRWLHRAAADTAAGGDDGMAAITDIFYWCCRNVVTLDEDRARGFATSPYQRLYVGHGSADERAWVFCAMVEALNYWVKPGGARMEYDVMILKTGGSTLVAAGDEERACVFDMDLCLPVYGPDGKKLVPLDALRGPDGAALNTGLDGVPYPYTAADIRDARYLIPFSPDAAAFRQALLLPCDVSGLALIHRPKKNYRPLYEDVLAKIEKAVRRHFSHKVDKFEYPYKDPDGGTLELWAAPFELERLSALSGAMDDKNAAPDSEEIKSLKPEERKKLDDYRALTRAVVDRVGPLQPARRLQIEGKYEPVAREYRRMLKEAPLSDAQKEDAAYFRSLALLDIAYRLGDEAKRKDAFREAGTAFEEYLETYPDGLWYDGARYHLALAYLELGEKEEALNQLSRVRGSLRLPAQALVKQNSG